MLQRESLVFYKSFNNLWPVVHRKVPELCVCVSPDDAEDWRGDVEGGSVTVDLVYSLYMSHMTVSLDMLFCELFIASISKLDFM